MTTKFFDEELLENVTIRDKNNYGFCQLCGSVNLTPKKVGKIWVCKECKKTRLEDARKMSKAYEELEE